jgi:hypothetical protein
MRLQGIDASLKPSEADWFIEEGVMHSGESQLMSVASQRVLEVRISNVTGTNPFDSRTGNRYLSIRAASAKTNGLDLLNSQLEPIRDSEYERYAGSIVEPYTVAVALTKGEQVEILGHAVSGFKVALSSLVESCGLKPRSPISKMEHILSAEGTETAITFANKMAAAQSRPEQYGYLFDDSLTAVNVTKGILTAVAQNLRA